MPACSGPEQAEWRFSIRRLEKSEQIRGQRRMDARLPLGQAGVSHHGDVIDTEVDRLLRVFTCKEDAIACISTPHSAMV
jgi:hypothetical protein